MSPSPPPSTKKNKKMKEGKKQKQLRNQEETREAVTTTSTSPRKRKNGHVQHGKDRNDDTELNKNKKRKEEKKLKMQKSQDHREVEEGKGGDDGSGGHGRRKRITDPRFASVHSDPRFQRMPRHQAKVAIDSRFAGAFKDERFALSTAPVDKRGKQRKGKLQNPMLHYYVQEGWKETGVKEDEERTGVEDAVPHSALTLRSDGEGQENWESGSDDSSSSSSSSSSEDDEEEDDQDSIGSDIAHYLMGNHDDTPQIEDATRRLAVVNMDWDHIKAVDIFAVMRSCLPKEGHISSVAIYPSEIGLKCMEIERTQGPSALIGNNREQDGSDMEDSEAEVDTENESKKWRSYELNRLRYYYAVVDCDSSITANRLYESLDGTELLKTSNVFDLRFIPDSMEFTHPPRDIATKIPSNYKEPDFHTRALQHSNVKLSWEEDEPKRKILRRKFNSDQLDEMEFTEFLASDDDGDEEEDNENLHGGETHELENGEKYLALLQGAEGSDAEDGDQDMEISFNTGLEDITKRILEKKDLKSETVWEAYLRRRKEKKKARKKTTTYSSDDDDNDESDSDNQQDSYRLDQHDDFFEEHSDADVITVKGKQDKRDKQSSKLEKDQEASQAELDLLCANADRPESSSEDEDARYEKVKKKGKKLPSENKLPKEDYHDDPRFSALFTSHLYALDPTDPQFKRSATYARQMVKKQKESSRKEQMAQKKSSEQNHLPPETIAHEPSATIQPDDRPSKKVHAEVFSMVRSLKRRTEALKGAKKEN